MRLILILLIAFTPPAIAQVYKWTDESGVTHFGSQPPPGTKEEVKIQNIESGSTGDDASRESDIIRQARELERQRERASLRNAEARYRERVTEIREDYQSRPDYICQGAENRLQSARERWDTKKKQGYTINEERYYEQQIRDRERHRNNVCR
ncbi:hypothetical protein CLH62_14625 [Marinobacter guineae]|uniref:DUF4124 domain-containing protein n=1 Tax=Marinobacter guineae TaxID=432303 RepID=A0A2G1VBN9_9GAMM|nr:DUF4124 domain-containing protein [Marinobacter guineae]PHQ24166.1 hypothetical protein CLH62_14625 [Marinobacter guineae]